MCYCSSRGSILLKQLLAEEHSVCNGEQHNKMNAHGEQLQ